MTFVSWRRAMVAGGILLLLLGATMMIGGGLYAGRQQYTPDDGGNVMAGIWVGTFGTLGVVTGVVVLKLGLMGPYPAHLRSQAEEAKD
jgi:hypothetical protein